MTSLAIGDLVWVPYPHVEDNRRRSRPALIVAAKLGEGGALCWAVMITSAARPAWPGDIAIADHQAAGLPIPSKIRTEKIATLESAAATRIGRLPQPVLDEVAKCLVRHLRMPDIRAYRGRLA